MAMVLIANRVSAKLVDSMDAALKRIGRVVKVPVAAVVKRELPGDAGFYEVSLSSFGVESSGRGIINLFSLYYDLENRWFYLTDPRDSLAVPMFSMEWFLYSLDLVTPQNIDNLVVEYKYTGDLMGFVSGLVEMSEIVPYLRYLLMPEVGNVSVEKVLERMRNLALEISRAVFDIRASWSSFYYANYTEFLSNPNGQMAGNHMVSTVKNHRPEGNGHVDLMIYSTCAPINRVGRVWGNLTRREAVGLNSYDMLEAESSLYNRDPYFDVVAFNPSDSPTLSGMPRKVKTSVSTSLSKLGDKFQAADITGDYRNIYNPANMAGSSEVGRPDNQVWIDLRDIFRLVRRVAEKMGEVGV